MGETLYILKCKDSNDSWTFDTKSALLSFVMEDENDIDEIDDVEILTVLVSKRSKIKIDYSLEDK